MKQLKCVLEATKCRFCILFFVLPLFSYAQVELQKIAPLSPNAASMLRFTETNISHYTGAANVNFPIYSLNSGSLQLNLSLGYNSTGNKVEDIASWVGLGWNLSTVPVVTRTVRSLPDESAPGISIPYQGIYKIDDIIEISNTINHPSGETANMICEIANGTLDTEPDYFHYTLLDNRSGSFYWDPFQEKYQTYPYRNLKIKKIGAGSIDRFEIIDEIGNIYLFSEYETSQSSGTFNGPTERNAWYVTSIFNSNRTDSLTFGYSPETVVTRTLNPMRKELNGSCPDNSSVMSTTTVHAKVPFSIQFTGGKVNFVPSASYREDLSGSYALGAVEVLDNSDNLIKRVNFHYEYTTAVSYDPLCVSISSLPHEKKRLFLKSFAEMGSGDSISYAFEYNNTIIAPCRVSSAQDFWGYYNGQSQNQNLIPEIPQYLFLQAVTAPGANRFVNPSVNQFGILKRIYFPTGGYSEFDYETHRILDSTGKLPAVYINKTAYLLPEHETSTNTFIDTISIYSDEDLFINNSEDGGSFVDIMLGDKQCVSDPPPAPNCAGFFVRGIDSWNIDVNFPVSNNISLLHLRKGRYEIKAVFAQDYISEQGFFMYLKWREQDTTVTHRYVGGLRVKEIRNVDSAGNQYTKKYRYNNTLNSDTSSGGLIGGSGFFRLQTTVCPDMTATYIVADNNASIGSQGGSYVGYSNVIELVDSAAHQGYVQYQYNQSPDYVSTASPFVPPIDYSEFRGRLINQKIYKYIGAGFKLVSEERNTYRQYMMDSISFFAMKTLKAMQGAACEIENATSGLIYVNQTYYYMPILSTQTNRRTILFNQDNADSIVTQFEYYYNPLNWQVNRQVTTSSKNESIEEFSYYAIDSANSGNPDAVWDTLIRRNMIAIPLKKINKVSNAVTSTLINKYGQDVGTGHMQLKELWHSYKNNTPVAKVLFTYSSSGKLLEQQKVNDVKEVYLWGYNSKYPVARVLNSTHAIASDYITQSMLDNPSSDEALRNHLANLRTIPGTQVTIYTYKPLVGITSETDPAGRTTYYEYDDHNRLALVRDQNSHILKKICYNYAGQPQDCGAFVYTSVAQSGTFTRNNCGTNGSGSSITYNVAAGAYTSIVSQADANLKATNDVAANGQAYANANASCTWMNQAQSASFTRNNCGTNGTGGAVTYTVAANTYSSTTSLADANQQAVNAVNAGGQAYANANAGCTWYNQAQSGSFTRNNCADGGTGGTVTYTIAPNTYSSTTSLAAANQLAVNSVNAGGQVYANANATCTWYNTVQSGNFTRNNCGAGGTGGTVTYTISASTYSSTVSQADANQQAVNAVNAGGQAYANANATCTWYNTAQSGSFTRNNCGTGGAGGTVTYTIAASTYSSTVSQADANQQAVNAVNTNGQAYANANAGCTWYNQAMSQAFTRNNCPVNYIGESAIYSVAANTYSSSVSLAAANQLAQNDINANGQAYANANGGCIYSCNSGNCSGQDKKCVNGVCETGYRVYTSSSYDGTTYACVYHYEFSDGSWSQDYTEYTSANCMEEGDPGE